MNPNQDDLNNLPQWPADAKDLPDSAFISHDPDDGDPPRYQFSWIVGMSLGSAVFGLIVTLNLAYFFISGIGGIFLGLIAEHAAFDRERRRRNRRLR